MNIDHRGHRAYWARARAKIHQGTTAMAMAWAPPSAFSAIGSTPEVTGPSTVLVLVLGIELLCGDCASVFDKGGVGAADASLVVGLEV